MLLNKIITAAIEVAHIMDKLVQKLRKIIKSKHLLLCSIKVTEQGIKINQDGGDD